jgi:hypothetical protein
MDHVGAAVAFRASGHSVQKELNKKKQTRLASPTAAPLSPVG